MIIGGIYSFKQGREIIENEYGDLLAEVRQTIASIDCQQHKTKQSKEKTMPGRILYNPRSLNRAFKAEFAANGWASHKEVCEYPTEFYTEDYQPKRQVKGAFREMDFIKKKVGVEVQFGKYAFMVYNVCAKMTIFHNLQLINVGIEIVPLKEFAKQMSTGVSYFEQFVWDLRQRGVADIDIPVLILGITTDSVKEDDA